MLAFALRRTNVMAHAMNAFVAESAFPSSCTAFAHLIPTMLVFAVFSSVAMYSFIAAVSGSSTYCISLLYLVFSSYMCLRVCLHVAICLPSASMVTLTMFSSVERHILLAAAVVGISFSFCFRVRARS